jgi:hypothetical protein
MAINLMYQQQNQARASLYYDVTHHLRVKSRVTAMFFEQPALYKAAHLDVNSF